MAKLDKPFVNRIVGHGEEDVDQMLASPLNFRIHPDNQQQALAGSIDDIGYIRSVTVSKRSGRVLDGHLRVALAMRSGVKSLPVEYVDLDEAEEAQALLSLDPIAALAATDRQKLDELLHQVQSDDERVQQMMADMAEREELYIDDNAGRDAEPADIEPDRFVEIAKKWSTGDGQLWRLGNHKILCADSLIQDNINKLMGDEIPALIIADPPYGVNIVAANVSVGGGEAYNIPFGGRKKGYVGGENSIKDRTGHYPIESWNKERFTGSDGASKPFGSKSVRGTVGSAHIVEVGKYPVIIGDENTDTAEKAVKLYLDVYPNSVHVWWGANYYSNVLSPSQCWLVWYKETTGNFADCELAWTNQNKAARLFQHKWNGMLRDSEHERRWHPTQKPAALAAWVFEKFTEKDSIILDPFAGAGWSILGGEQCGRRVMSIEKSHEYIAVVLERWSIMTGKMPELIT